MPSVLPKCDVVLLVKTACLSVLHYYVCNKEYIYSAEGTVHNTKKLKKTSPAIKKELFIIRQKADEIRDRWVKDEENWRTLPARAWPETQPSVEEIPNLQKSYERLCSGNHGNSVSTEACKDTTFFLATALLFNSVDVEKGLELFESLADGGDVRGQTAAGICYVEGLGVDSDEEKGSKLLQHAANSGFLQATYEMGALYYNGNALPFVKEDVQMAFRLFELTAAQNHTSGLYMTADMLLSGEGCEEKDVPRAIRLLYLAGERGHRNARATLWALLREYE